MQTAAVSVLLAELNGRRGEALHPVPSQFENMLFMPGHIVMKTKISCLTPEFNATKFELVHLLENSEVSLPLQPSRLIMEKFSNTQKETVKGLLDVQFKGGNLLNSSRVIAHDFGINVKGSDEIELSVSDVNLEKLEIDVRKLVGTNIGAVNMKHPLICQAQRYMAKRKLLFFKKSKTLCLVVGCVVAANDFTVTTVVHKKVDGGVKDVLDTIGPDLSVEQKSGREKRTQRSAIVKKGTIVAYEIRELNVEADGRLEILLSEDGRGKLRRLSKSTPCGIAQGQGACDVAQEVIMDVALSSIHDATDDEKENIREAIRLSIERGDPGVALREEVERVAGPDDENDDLDVDSAEMVPMRTLSAFTMKDEKIGQSAAGSNLARLQSMTDARVSGLKVLSRVVSELPVEVTENLVTSAAGQGLDVEHMLNRLIEDGTVTTESHTLVPIAEKLGCTVTEDAGKWLIRKPPNEESLVSAFVVAHCLQSKTQNQSDDSRLVSATAW